MALEVALERGDDRFRHRDVADASGRLRTTHLDAGRQLLALLVHDDAPVEEVEVAAREPEKFAEAQAARRREEQERSVRRVNGLHECESVADWDQRSFVAGLQRRAADPAPVLGDEVVLGGGVQERHQEPVALRRLRRAHAC